MTKEQKKSAAWIVAIIVFLAGVALASCQNKVAPVIDVLMLSLGIGESAAGWLSSVFTVMGIVTAVPAYWLLEKLGVRKVGIIALGCAAVGSAIGALSENFILLIISRVIEGTGVGMIAVAGPSAIAMWFPAQKRAAPMGLWSAWQGFAQTVVFLVGGGIAVNWGWQGVWWLTAICCVVVLVLYAWKVKEPGEGMINYAADEEDTSTKIDFVEGFKSPSAWILGFAFLVYSGIALSFGTYFSLYLADTFFAGDMNASNGFVSNLFLIEVIVCVVAGFVFNFVPADKRRFVTAGFFVLYAALLFFAFVFTSEAMIIPFIIVFPIIEGALCCLLWTIAPSTAKKPNHTSAVIAIQNICFNMGFVIFPPFIGFFIESAGWGVAAWPLAIAAILGGVAMLFVKTYNFDGKKELEQSKDIAA